MANSYVLYTGTGAQTDWAVPFPYLSQDHVHVFADGVEVTSGVSWLSAGTVRVSPALASGVAVKIARQTPTTPLVNFANRNTLTEDNLSTATLQAIYVAEEAEDRASDSITLDGAGNFDFQGNRGVNLADPVDDQDAATKKWVTDNTSIGSAAAAAASAAASATSAGDALTQALAAGDSAAAAEAARALLDAFAFFPETYDALAGTAGHASHVAIQAAIDAAGDAGGGVVWFGPKNYEIADGLVVNKHNVELQGVGHQGFIQDLGLTPFEWTQSGGSIITWTGADNAGDIMLSFAPPATGPRLQGCGYDGLVLDGAALASKGLFIASCHNGKFRRITVAHCRATNIVINVLSDAAWTASDPRDTQHNDFGYVNSVTGWRTNTENTLGIIIDADDAADVSSNHFEEIFFTHKNAIGLLIGSSDYCSFGKVLGFRLPGGTAFGMEIAGGTSTADYPRKHRFGMVQPGPGGLKIAANTLVPREITIEWYDLGNGTAVPEVDAGCLNIDIHITTGEYGVNQRTIYKNLTATAVGANSATAQPWFPSAGAVTLRAGTYRFRGLLITTRAAGTTSHTTSVLYGGTATVGSIAYTLVGNSGDVFGLAAATKGTYFSAAASLAKAASTSATEATSIEVEGTVRITADGTFIPQFQYSVAPGGAPTIAANSFFELSRIGVTTEASKGQWA